MSHGWNDGYGGTTVRSAGVPWAVAVLTNTFSYNDLDSVRDALDFCCRGFEYALAANWGNDRARNGQAKKWQARCFYKAGEVQAMHLFLEYCWSFDLRASCKRWPSCWMSGVSLDCILRRPQADFWQGFRGVVSLVFSDEFRLKREPACCQP